MRDFGLLLSLAVLASLALWRPWLGVIGLTFFGYLQPHTFVGGLAREFPVYKILFAATLAGTLFTRDRQLPPRDWRVLALLGFWLGMLVTTYTAIFASAAWPRLFEASGVLASTFLILILINTREKLFTLIAAIAASFALVTLKGGYWAVIHGFADRVYGPPGSQFYDNNFFAVAAVMTIPLLLLWFRQVADPWLKGVLGLTIALSLLAVLSSWSRGALLALVATLVLLAAQSRRKLVGAAAVVLVLGAALVLFPEQWLSRMETITTYQTDNSAQSRLGIWRKGLDFALGRPLLGVGFQGFAFGPRRLDWHSAYIEILAEHGFVVFLLWLSLLLGTFFALTRLTRLARAGRDRAEAGWEVDCARALRASLTGYCVGGAFLSIGHWDLLFHLIAASILLQSPAVGLASGPTHPRRGPSDPARAPGRESPPLARAVAGSPRQVPETTIAMIRRRARISTAVTWIDKPKRLGWSGATLA